MSGLLCTSDKRRAIVAAVVIDIMFWRVVYEVRTLPQEGEEW